MTRETYRTGLFAEKLCRFALRLKGYCILENRYKTPEGEIDIIAARGHTIAAVEVKARATQDEAVEALSLHQQQRIVLALQDYIMRHPRYERANLRFDVMLVTPWRWPRHIVNAWMAT